MYVRRNFCKAKHQAFCCWRYKLDFWKYLGMSNSWMSMFLMFFGVDKTYKKVQEVWNTLSHIEIDPSTIVLWNCYTYIPAELIWIKGTNIRYKSTHESKSLHVWWANQVVWSTFQYSMNTIHCFALSTPKFHFN